MLEHIKHTSDLEARLEAEARQCAEEDFQLGMLFQDMQEEAYTSWEAWDNALESLQRRTNPTDLDAFRNRRQQKRERQPDVPQLFDLAASEEQSGVEGEISQEDSSLIPVGTLEIEGVSYEVLADPEGTDVFISPYPNPSKVRLLLDASYRLARVAGHGNLCRIVNFEVADLQHFFAVRQREPHRYQIRFTEE